MDERLKNWILSVKPRGTCPAGQSGFEELHACPFGNESYLIWFTEIGDSASEHGQKTAVTAQLVTRPECFNKKS